jgi:poly-D-alanine transfer protein DltD
VFAGDSNDVSSIPKIIISIRKQWAQSAGVCNATVQQNIERKNNKTAAKEKQKNNETAAKEKRKNNETAAKEKRKNNETAANAAFRSSR